MSEQRWRFFNPEKVLFGVLAALLVLFVWRAGLLDPAADVAERALGEAGLDIHLPRAVAERPELPGPAYYEDVARETAPRRLALDERPLGSRNPFAPAADDLQVVAADLTALVEVESEQATADILIRYWILPQPVDEFRVLLPPGVGLVRAAGSGVIQPDQPDESTEDGDLYTIRLRAPARENFPLRLRISWSRPDDSDILDIPDVILPGTTHHGGLIALAAHPDTHVALLDFENLTPVGELDDLSLPEALSPSERHPLFAAFRYTHESPRPRSIKLNMSEGFTLAQRRDRPVRRPPRRDPRPEPGDEAEEPEQRRPPEVSPGTQVEPPEDERDEDEGPVEVSAARPEFQLPVSFMGTFRVDAENTYEATLRDQTGIPVKVSQGDVIYGLVVQDIGPGYVIVENEAGRLFRLRR